jgi:hypothetical protein
MRRRIDGGMAVDNELAVVAAIVKELVADPDQIILDLIRQRHAGADAGMAEEDLAAGMEGRQGFKKQPVFGEFSQLRSGRSRGSCKGGVCR